MTGLVGRAALLTAAAVLIGVTVNAARPGGIPLVAPRPYDIYVPCPETEARSESVSMDDLSAGRTVLYLDARTTADFERTRIKGAESFPYPVLDDPPAERVEALKRRGLPIVTYGEGGRGDMGEAMAALLTELGVPGVNHLEGGLAAWRERGGEVEGDATEQAPGAGEPGPDGGGP